MRTLLLVRHAKSSRDDASLPDRDRPLNARGEREAAEMAKRWLQRHPRPDLIVSSPAVRALATAQALAEGIDYERKAIVVNDDLYATTADALIAVIEELDDTLERVMLVGHNPEFTELAQRFSAEIDHMPTCAVASFAFEVDSWSDIAQARPAKTDLDVPKHASA
jgi:phosphohistidine phosphatase